MADIFVAPKKKKELQILETQEAPAAKPKPTYAIGEKVGFLTSFRLKPNNLSFRDQHEDEQIFLFLRRHFITNVPWIILSIILLILPPLVSFLTRGQNIFPFPIPNNYVVVITYFYYLLIFTFMFINFINWFFNISLVSDKRVLDLDYSDIIYHNVAVTKLNLIEDIDYVQSGFLRSFFNYGDVLIQTAGEKLHFDFLSIPNPQETLNVVENLIGGDRNV